MGLKTKKISKISALTYHFVTSLLKGKFTPNRPVSKIVMIMINILNVFLTHFLIQIYKSQPFCVKYLSCIVPPPHVPATSPQLHYHICLSTIMPRLSTRAIALRALTAATRRVRQIYAKHTTIRHALFANMTNAFLSVIWMTKAIN